MSKSRIIGITGNAVVLTGEAAIFFQEAERYCRAKEVEAFGDADPYHEHMMKAFRIMNQVTDGVG